MATSQTPAPAPAAPAAVAGAHRVLALLFFACGLVQFVLAGYSAFGGGDWDPHVAVGSLLVVIALAVLVLAAIGRREALQASAILFGLMILQYILGAVGDDAPVLGALHPLNGLLVLGAAMSAAAGRPLSFAHGGGRG